MAPNHLAWVLSRSSLPATISSTSPTGARPGPHGGGRLHHLQRLVAADQIDRREAALQLLSELFGLELHIRLMNCAIAYRRIIKRCKYALARRAAGTHSPVDFTALSQARAVGACSDSPLRGACLSSVFPARRPYPARPFR